MSAFILRTDIGEHDLDPRIDQGVRFSAKTPYGQSLESVRTHVRRALGEAWDNPAAWQGSSDAGGLDLPNEPWGTIVEVPEDAPPG